MHILVVDGAAGVSDIVVQMLKMNGYHAGSAMTIDKAIQALSDKRYDACIVDLEIEDQAGRLPTLLQARDVRSIAWTASEDFWRGGMKAARYEFFLAKPSSFDMILAAVEGRACPACGRPIDADNKHTSCLWNQR